MKRIAQRLAILPIVVISFATCLSLRPPSLETKLKKHYECLSIGRVYHKDQKIREQESIKKAVIDYSFNCYDSVKDKEAFFKEFYDHKTGTAYFYNSNRLNR